MITKEENKVNLLIILIYLSYLVGFFFNENSIGSGGYESDFVWIWKNFDIFKNNNLFDAIQSKEFFGNRSHLLYILNYYFNPFLNEKESYRLSSAVFCLIGAYLFYLCLKIRFPEIKKNKLFLLSSLILLSPFYRVSAYWGMEIQYGIISLLISSYFYLKLKKIFKLKNLILLIVFSSTIVYFDIKLIIINLIYFFSILFSNNVNTRYKILSVILYAIFSLPYVYLIYIWEGLVPIATQSANPLQGTHFNNSSSIFNNLHLVNILFSIILIAFYIFPLLILRKFKPLRVSPLSIIFLSILLIYLFIFVFYDLYDYVDKLDRLQGGYKNYYGLGFANKISLIFFDSRNLIILSNIIMFLFSCIIIIYFFSFNIIECAILFFFLALSLILFPLMQEYFDPYIFIIGLIFFKMKLDLNLNKLYFVISYFSAFLVLSNLYYKLLN